MAEYPERFEKTVDGKIIERARVLRKKQNESWSEAKDRMEEEGWNVKSITDATPRGNVLHCVVKRVKAIARKHKPGDPIEVEYLDPQQSTTPDSIIHPSKKQGKFVKMEAATLTIDASVDGKPDFWQFPEGSIINTITVLTDVPVNEEVVNNEEDKSQ